MLKGMSPSFLQSQVGHSPPSIKPQIRILREDRSPLGKPMYSLALKSYEQPTVSFKSRFPSPYTRRRMCELSNDSRQCLAHVNPGPYEFKKEEISKPLFVVRQIERSRSMSDIDVYSCSPRKSTWNIWTKIHQDPSLLGSYRPKKHKRFIINRIASAQKCGMSKTNKHKPFAAITTDAIATSLEASIISEPPKGDLDGSSASFAEYLISKPAGKQFHSAGLLMTHSVPSSVQNSSLSPLLNRCSLRERFQPDPNTPTKWEDLHERVKKIVRTHSATQRQRFDENILRKEDLEKKTSATFEISVCDSELHDRSLCHHNPSVHLDNGEYWSNRAALYKGKSHRDVFDESLEKIYRNMYKTAMSEYSLRRKSYH